MVVKFTPTSTGAISGTIAFEANLSHGPFTSGSVSTLALSGTGTAAPTRIIGLSGNLAFGDVQVGTSATTTLTLSNSGNSTLTWSGLSTGNGVFTASATSGTVAAGGSANVTLTFTPAAATSYSSTLTVTSDATSGTNTTTLSGTGTAAATRIIGISGDPSWADIRADDNGGAVLVGSSLSVTFDINNTGNSPLTVSGIDTGHAVFTASPTSGTVAAGASMTVTVTFTPTAVGQFHGAFVVTSNATSGSWMWK